MRELELIVELQRIFATSGHARVVRGIGDDAAVVRARPYAVTSVDGMVDGIHFRNEWLGPEQIGHRALAAALSDIAAMGAEVGEAFLFLGLPAGADPSLATGIARGATDLAARHGAAVIGGDITRAASLTVSFAVTGWCDDPGELVFRDGARAGDQVVVTGRLGGAGAGLALVDGRASDAPDIDTAGLRSAYALPEPRVRAGRELALAGATAMIDVSDGIATDVGHLARASGVTIELSLSALPLAQSVAEVAAQLGEDAAAFAATAGEDFELCACLAPGVSIPGTTVIGRVLDGPPEVRFSDWNEPLAGYEHSL